MRTAQEEALAKHLTEWVKKGRETVGADLPAFSEDTDLIATGILD